LVVLHQLNIPFNAWIWNILSPLLVCGVCEGTGAIL